MAAAVEPDHWVDPADADRKGFWIFGHLLLITIAGMLIAFLVWADNAVLDIVTRGAGQGHPLQHGPGDPEPGRRHHGRHPRA